MQIPKIPKPTSTTVRKTNDPVRTLLQDETLCTERDASAAVKAWITRANPRGSTAQLRAALRELLKEETASKGRRFRSGREAMRWLEG